jgi:hypothetical protein
MNPLFTVSNLDPGCQERQIGRSTIESKTGRVVYPSESVVSTAVCRTAARMVLVSFDAGFASRPPPTATPLTSAEYMHIHLV